MARQEIVDKRRSCWVVLRIGPFTSEEVGKAVGQTIAKNLADLGQVTVDVVECIDYRPQVHGAQDGNEQGD